MDRLLISDAAVAYKAFDLEAAIMHTTVNLRTGVRSRGSIRIQNVDAWHSCYLSDYTGWQPVLDSGLCATPARLLHAAMDN
jgi:hypothetical protein